MEGDAALASIQERLKTIEKELDWMSRYLRGGNGSGLPSKVAVLETKQIDNEEELDDLRNDLDSWMVQSRSLQEALEQEFERTASQQFSKRSRWPSLSNP